MPRATRRFVALALGLVMVVATAPGALAQADPFDQQITDAEAEVQAAQAAAHEAAARLALAQEQLTAVETQIAAVQAHIAELEAQIPALRAEVKRLRAMVRERAAALYKGTGPNSKFNALPLNPTLEALRRQRLTEAAAKQDDDTMDQLEETAALLEVTKEELATQQEQLTVEQAALAEVESELVAQQGEFDRRVAVANAALDRARALGALRARGEPVMGPTILTAAQMAAWWRTRDYSFRVAGTTIDELAQIFVEEGQAENVRGDLAFAQAIVETGGFHASPNNNFAGMGWCDSCSTGRRFPTARDGVRAQIQHLKNYADRYSLSSGLAHPPSPYWYGSNPATAKRNFDTFFAKGWAPTWTDMGHGNWATSTRYSTSVLNVYNDMVAYAQVHG
ncbi:MAG: hypothetical protein EXQ79_07680 [Acidimicrobiia bacterium]|nr:hypothetical protein [Acidimicrobiia bacterium]